MIYDWREGLSRFLIRPKKAMSCEVATKKTALLLLSLIIICTNLSLRLIYGHLRLGMQ